MVEYHIDTNVRLRICELFLSEQEVPKIDKTTTSLLSNLVHESRNCPIKAKCLKIFFILIHFV